MGFTNWTRFSTIAKLFRDKDLGKKAIIALIPAAGLTSFFVLKQSKTAEESYPFLGEGKQLISKNAIVKDLVGHPIEFKPLKPLDHKGHVIVGDVIMLSLDFNGPKNRGFAEFYGLKKDTHWVLKRVQIRLCEEHGDKRMILYKTDDDVEAPRDIL